MKKNKNIFIEADEVFLDSKNLPNFNTYQMEGKIEKPLAKTNIFLFFILSGLLGIILLFQSYQVQIIGGKKFAALSSENALNKSIIFAPRGVIYDRNQVRLAWNEESDNQKDFLARLYIGTPGFSHILGYVNYPKKDKKGFFWRPDYIGADGIERQFNKELAGQNGARIIETKSDGTQVGTNVINPPIQGSNITLSIDKNIQEKLYDSVKNTVDGSGYEGGGAALMKLDTGEILGMVSVPEYDSNIITQASDIETVENYFINKRKPLLNRVITGLYSPGSIIKPFIGMGALTEGVITKDTKILSAGSISIPNVYNPGKKSVFVDYRPNNGWVNIREALSVSSNIFFYNVGGGYQSQKGIGIEKIGEYVSRFGIAHKTGIELPGEVDGNIPSVSWKEKVFPGDPWRIGDTYNTAIGQYGFQVTPIEMLHAVSIIANKGLIVQQTLLKNDSPIKKEDIGLPKEHFETIIEGMRLVVTSPIGTVKAFNENPLKIAAKTGTAQVGVRNEYINGWVIGFFPYDNPQYAFVGIMDRGTNVSSPSASSALKTFLDWFATTPEGKKIYERN